MSRIPIFSRRNKFWQREKQNLLRLFFREQQKIRQLAKASTLSSISVPCKKKIAKKPPEVKDAQPDIKHYPGCRALRAIEI